METPKDTIAPAPTDWSSGPQELHADPYLALRALLLWLASSREEFEGLAFDEHRYELRVKFGSCAAVIAQWDWDDPTSGPVVGGGVEHSAFGEGYEPHTACVREVFADYLLRCFQLYRAQRQQDQARTRVVIQVDRDRLGGVRAHGLRREPLRG